MKLAMLPTLSTTCKISVFWIFQHAVKLSRLNELGVLKINWNIYMWIRKALHLCFIVLLLTLPLIKFDTIGVRKPWIKSCKIIFKFYIKLKFYFKLKHPSLSFYERSFFMKLFEKSFENHQISIRACNLNIN